MKLESHDLDIAFQRIEKRLDGIEALLMKLVERRPPTLSAAPGLMPENGLLRIHQVLKVFPISRSTWYRGIQEGKFPKPVRAHRWRVSRRDNCPDV